MNTYTKDYKVNFINNDFIIGLDTTQYMTDYSMQCVEYINSDGITCRAIATDEASHLSSGISILTIRVQLFINNIWTTISKDIKRKATRHTFVKVDTQENVSYNEAVISVDDIDDEILDRRGISYDPKKYKQVNILKDGYKTEFDNFITIFGISGASHHNIHKIVIMNACEITVP